MSKCSGHLQVANTQSWSLQVSASSGTGAAACPFVGQHFPQSVRPLSDGSVLLR
jgi:hypothetical protein